MPQVVKKVLTGLKKSKLNIAFARILLICFIAGQAMVYAHQHNYVNYTGKIYNTSKSIPQQTVTEKCSLCDVMLHNAMVASVHVYFAPVAVTGHVYNKFEYSFTSIQLILSCGRAPPLS